LATTLADGGAIAVIDTEHGSASKYADSFEFDTQELTIFSVSTYIAAIKEAEQVGYAVLVIDSLSHAWTGIGGLMEQKDAIAKQKYRENGFSAWLDAGKIQNQLVGSILGSKMHVIVTIRSKMEYIVELINGKQTPRKVALAPVQRDDLPYEFDVFATMESDNTMIIDKSRCPALAGQVIAKPGTEVAETLKKWLAGIPAPVVEAPPPAPPEQESPKTKAAYSRRFLAIYDRCKRLDLFAHGDNGDDNLAAFYVFSSRLLNTEITDHQQLTPPRLDIIEKYAAQAEAKQQSITSIIV
jgi:hypothetical protein